MSHIFKAREGCWSLRLPVCCRAHSHIYWLQPNAHLFGQWEKKRPQKNTHMQSHSTRRVKPRTFWNQHYGVNYDQLPDWMQHCDQEKAFDAGLRYFNSAT